MKRLGWVVAGAAAGLAASAFAGVLASDRRARERFAVSARQVRERVEETGERWSAGAGEWRERRSEEMGRALLSAAEARDATLEDDEGDEVDEVDDEESGPR